MAVKREPDDPFAAQNIQNGTHWFFESSFKSEREFRGRDLRATKERPRANHWREVAKNYIWKLTSTLRSTGVGPPSRIVGSYFLSETALRAACSDNGCPLTTFS